MGFYPHSGIGITTYFLYQQTRPHQQTVCTVDIFIDSNTGFHFNGSCIRCGSQPDCHRFDYTCFNLDSPRNYSRHSLVQKHSEPKPAGKIPTQQERFLNALNTLIVVFPVVMVFYFFQWAGGLLILIFIAILSMQPSFNLKTGFLLILGNFVGGIYAIIMYEFLVIVPEFSFLILLILLAGLFLAARLFSERKTAPLYGMSFSTLLLIIGQATSTTSDAGDKVWIRVVEIMIAVIYVVLAFAILNFLKERRLNKKAGKKEINKTIG